MNLAVSSASRSGVQAQAMPLLVRSLAATLRQAV
jgi:hypothetical protein